MEQHTYIAIDLKSFFASVECVERGRNPLTTHLVVADESRTEKTICLAVTPSLKAYGLPTEAHLPLPELIEAMKLDKKTMGNKLKVVLLHEIGDAYAYPTSIEFFAGDRQV